MEFLLVGGLIITVCVVEGILKTFWCRLVGNLPYEYSVR